jgi:hypothetical protein
MKAGPKGGRRSIRVVAGRTVGISNTLGVGAGGLGASGPSAAAGRLDPEHHFWGMTTTKWTANPLYNF